MTAVVYAGPFYGRTHRVLSRNAWEWTLLHEPTGTVVRVPPCDVEGLPDDEDSSDGDRVTTEGWKS